MTKAQHYTEKPVADWNVRDFHAWLADENKRRWGVDYQPFGRGSKSQRWGYEQGALKQAIAKYGAEVVHRWLANELDEYRSTPQYPCLTFGFVYAYHDRGLARAQAEVARKQQATDVVEVAGEEMDDMF